MVLALVERVMELTLVDQIIHLVILLMEKQLHLEQNHRTHAIAVVEWVIMHQNVMQRHM